MASPPPFTVTHVTSADDFPALVQVEALGFHASEGIGLMFHSNDALSTVGINNHIKSWSSDPNTRYLKASLPDGTIIGLAKWYLFLDPPARPDPWDIEFAPAGEKLGKWFFGKLNEAREGRLGGKKHMLMATLVVHPEYQRMGIGHELLRWGLAKADEEQVECWIDASPFGLGLYKKFGWEEVGYVEMDLKDWRGGESKVSRTVHMVRPPTAK